MFQLETGNDIMNTQPADDTPVLGPLLTVGVVMFAGQGGTGKSTVLATAAAHVTNGLPLTPWEPATATRQPAGVLWLTVEEDMREIVAKRHMHLGGDLDLLLRPKINRHQDSHGHWHAVDFDIEQHLPGLLAQATARGTPIRLVVCDSLPGLVQWGKSRSTTSDTDVKKMLGRLADTARAHGCCIAGIGHWNKKADLDEAFRISGAQAWRDTPRVSFTVERGFIYVNKANDLPEIGCTFQQEVVAVLREIPAVTEDGKPLHITARRAAFGAHLMAKSELLQAKAAATGDAAMPAIPTGAKKTMRRIDRLCAETRDLFDLLGSPIPSSVVWRAVEAAYSRPNGEEQKAIRARLGLRLDEGKKPVLLSIV